ncbi:serpin family protein [Rhodohalobacter sulfatireducens]|uniref:Serpin family protein n=1 Tax=Rhodohalobacter sulfatireducens TaxID=2911366 RepID=A0ABS9K968_9BACT|nr:serpin family protein [Rhodohalobacter sulfatireducens]MCG2587402.1 serpin family protein [Rhodohalobacter sulfatireducens]
MSTIRSIILIFPTFFLALLLATCQSDVTGPGEIHGELPRELTASEKQLVEADQSFSYDIFRQTVSYDNEEENLFISPLSISTALAMTLNGAEGETLEQMKEALHLNGMDTGEINEAFQSLIELLVSLDPKVTMKIANSVWHEQSLVVEDDFLQRLEDFYDAEVAGLDFRNSGSVDTINSWVNENTEGKIEKIIDRIPPEMVMYLINAIYFKGDWLSKFDKDETRKADFHLESGETVQVDMMSQKERYAVNFSEEVRMIELPYGDSLFTMSVLMPGDPEMPLNQFIEEEVTKENLVQWRSNLRVSEVPLELPKFEMEYEITYNDILKSMGMEKAFDEGAADFSGIADVSPQSLYISEVKHKTFVSVDEEGTEAAAVTSVGVGVTSLPPSMIVNRPFVFIIHERESGTNLFMGKVKDPSVL